MPRRILSVALSAVVLAVLVFGVPLAVVVRHVIRNDERGELERLALRAAASVSPGFRRGDLIELPAAEPGVQVAVYDRRGERVAGVGPSALELGLRPALSGRVVDTGVGDQLAVAVPTRSAERVIAVVRSASSASAVTGRVDLAWAGMAALAILAAGCAGLLAAHQSRRLARPMMELERVARDLGDGDFSVRAAPSGVPEIDDAGAALNRTASRLEAILERERAFAAQASHQLRTPLTRLRLQLETGLAADDEDGLHRAARGALTSAEHLTRIIDDVLSLARSVEAVGSRLDVEALFDDLKHRWHGLLAERDRPLVFLVDDSTEVVTSLPAVRQILDVLLDNAYRHGAGSVAVVSRDAAGEAADDAAGALAIDVTDEGRERVPVTEERREGSVGSVGSVGPRPPRPRRLGLAMARSLAAAAGGRILVAQDATGTRFTLLLPTSTGVTSAGETTGPSAGMGTPKSGTQP